MKRSKAGTTLKKSSDGLNYRSDIPSAPGSPCPEAVDELLVITNVTYTYNPSTTPWGKNTVIINIICYYYI